MSTTKKSNDTSVPRLANGQTFVHNKSRGTFHVPLNNPDPDAKENPIVFQLNEVRKINAAWLEEQRFIDCLEGGFLEVFDEAAYAAFLKEQAREKAAEARKTVTGVHPESGLPMNRTMALQQIGMITDSDLLEALAEKDNRASIKAAIEERLEEIAEDGFVDENSNAGGYL